MPAVDGQEYPISSAGQEWLVSWHPASLDPPEGMNHGSAAVCFVEGDGIILVSADGESWVLPGGRPEGAETWRETMEREVLEEACAVVEAAALLGYTRGECIAGPETGRVIVRSIWSTTVTLLAWDPAHEITHRLIVAPSRVLARLDPPSGSREIYERILLDAIESKPFFR